ncbi:methylmalonyl-CoA mutase, large subunit [Ferroglobus placidus DSM 10642]|uniref:Methylmalonyl-CoA mutase, large subunit n=1 Tax=Ferroglobus placidus (strain DSM 10642 / AEDII12DO) TaxID=589924 RepID=D3RZ16_FERPA|nr:methylmalonyl-CoA mutase family protein [Ferroglobus placidus]ADC65729.1 methylmalonyl-CoA mutase, large subunit [Ferroglobus placidus DSM 10642]
MEDELKKKEIERIRKKREEWEKNCLQPFLEKAGERDYPFETLSGIEVKRVYDPEDIAHIDFVRDIGYPGEFPFTRGVYPTMYRGRLWTMRQFSGFGTAEDTNRRWKMLLKEGQTGLSTAFDFPTLMGLDSDDPLADGEVGKVGVAVDTLKDFEILFDGIPLDKISTSFTINPPAAIILAMYTAIGDMQGVPRDQLRGTIQNDMLKEFHAQNTIVLPPEPSVKIIVDIFEWGIENVPKFNLISISGYHIREAGSTAVQELAFTIADGMAYVEAAMERGIDVDRLAPQLSFFFNAHNNFFEEIAKFRAARRMWAKIMRDEFGAKNPRSWWMKFHVQTAGCTLTAQQPLNNIVRVTIQAMAAVLGGCQSLHTNSFDEAWALPSEEAVRVALRTQQIIAYESGIPDTIDPLAGSYYVEWLTDKMEKLAWKYIEEIRKMGEGSVLQGVLRGIENGFFVKEISNAAAKYQKEVEEGRRIIVGVNKFTIKEKLKIPILKVDPEVQRRQIERLKKVKAERDNEAVKEALEWLRNAAENDENVMPPILEAVKNYATVGEIMGVLKEVYGTYRKPIII